MKDKLTKEIKNLKSNNIILAILPRENFHELNMHALKQITRKKPKGAYVSVNKPYSKILETMNRNKINSEEILFIDCVTRAGLDNKNCIYIKSAESLTNIAIALDSVYKNSGHKFVFLDSVDALSVYHSANTLIRFMRSFIEKVRENNKMGVVVGLSDATDKRVIDEISLVCDKVIRPD